MQEKQDRTKRNQKEQNFGIALGVGDACPKAVFKIGNRVLSRENQFGLMADISAFRKQDLSHQVTIADKVGEKQGDGRKPQWKRKRFFIAKCRNTF